MQMFRQNSNRKFCCEDKISRSSRHKQCKIILPSRVRVCSQDQYMLEILKKSQQTSKKCRHLEKQLHKIKGYLKDLAANGIISQMPIYKNSHYESDSNSNNRPQNRKKSVYCNKYVHNGLPQNNSLFKKISEYKIRTQPVQQSQFDTNIQPYHIVSTNTCSMQANQNDIYRTYKNSVKNNYHRKQGIQTDSNPYNFQGLPKYNDHYKKPNSNHRQNHQRQGSHRANRSISQNSYHQNRRKVGKFMQTSKQRNYEKNSDYIQNSNYDSPIYDSRCSLQRRLVESPVWHQQQQKNRHRNSQQKNLKRSKSIISRDSKMTLGNNEQKIKALPQRVDMINNKKENKNKKYKKSSKKSSMKKLKYNNY